jgi:hypothetical protein
MIYWYDDNPTSILCQLIEFNKFWRTNPQTILSHVHSFNQDEFLYSRRKMTLTCSLSTCSMPVILFLSSMLTLLNYPHLCLLSLEDWCWVESCEIFVSIQHAYSTFFSILEFELLILLILMPNNVKLDSISPIFHLYRN